MPERDPQTGELWTHPEFGNCVIYIDGDNVRTIRPSGTTVQFPLRGWVESRVHQFLNDAPLSSVNPHDYAYAITTARQHFDTMLFNYRNERQGGNRRELTIAHLYYLLIENQYHSLAAHPDVVHQLRLTARQYATWPMLEHRLEISIHGLSGEVTLTGPSRLNRVGIGWPFARYTENHGTILGTLGYTETPEEVAAAPNPLQAYRDEQQKQAIMAAVFEACVKCDWRLILPALVEPYRSIVRNHYEEPQALVEPAQATPTLWERLDASK